MPIANHRYSYYVKQRAKDPFLYLIALITLVIAAVNVATKLSDAADYGVTLSIYNPITTEYSSAAALIFILPWLFAFFDKNPMRKESWGKLAILYLSMSVLFSLVHVGMMVTMRNIAWPLLFDANYDFFDGGIGELFYEYRKDAITFLFYTVISELQRQIHAASSLRNQKKEPIILRSGASTIMVQADDFQFAKSAGNYAEINTKTGEHLARITLAALTDELKAKGCDVVRIHRSYIVNKALIRESSPIAGGDVMLKLSTGQSLRASRRYRENFES